MTWTGSRKAKSASRPGSPAGWSSFERTRAEACVHKALEIGINLIDTANVYGRGAAEKFLGEVLAPLKRSSFILATKLYFPMDSANSGLSAKQIRKQIDASLARLRTDYVDLYQCHRYDLNTPLEDTMEALTEVVRQGEADPRVLALAGLFPGSAEYEKPDSQHQWKDPERHRQSHIQGRGQNDRREWHGQVDATALRCSPRCGPTRTRTGTAGSAST